MSFNIGKYLRSQPSRGVAVRHTQTLIINQSVLSADMPNDAVDEPNVDLSFYRAYYADLASLSDIELERHWRDNGESEGRFSNPEELYLSLLKDRKVPDDFDTDKYIQMNPDLRDAFKYPYEIVDHFINVGIQERRQYRAMYMARSVFFDVDFYKDIYPDLNSKSKTDLTSHWFSQGREEGRFGSAQHALIALLNDEMLPKGFDVEAYLSLNPDLRESCAYQFEAVDHYLQFGVHENRLYSHDQLHEKEIQETSDAEKYLAECEYLDCEFYRENYSDLGELSDKELKNHWYFQGKGEGRFYSTENALEVLSSDESLPADFDADVYLRLNTDLKISTKWKFQAIHHYLEHGVHENRCFKETVHSVEEVVTDNFDVDFYRAFYPDLKDLSDENCLQHYVNTGHKEKREPNLENYIENFSGDVNLSARFNLPTYIRKNPDLIGHFENKWEYFKHYLQTGSVERRSYVADVVDVSFVKGFYGLEIASELTPSESLQKIRNQLLLNISEPVFLNEHELVNFYGFRFVEFLDLFDHEAYTYSNGEENLKLMNFSRSRCLEHFLVEGYKNCPIINYEHKFDPVFYGSEYRNSIMHLVRDDDHDSKDVWLVAEVTKRIYEHWIRHGIHEGKHANLSNYVFGIYGSKLPSKVSEEVECYQTLFAELNSLTPPSHVFESFISHGIEERKISETHNAETCEFYCVVANRFASDSKTDVAVRLYEEILSAVPNFPKALHHLGDELLKSKFYRKAIECYDCLISAGTATEWTFLNLSECYKNLDLYSDAARILKKARKVYPADIFINNIAAELLDKQLMLALDKSKHLVGLNRVEEGSEAIRDALAVFDIYRSDQQLSRNTGKIAIVGNHDLPQCRFYRIDQKYELLTQSGFKVDVFKHTENLNDFYSRLGTYEAVIFYRVPAIPSMIKAINATNIEGIPSIYDVDDLIFDTNHFPPPYESYAGQISRQLHGHLTVDTNLVEHAMRMCEYGIASTSSLAEHMMRYVRSGQVNVLFNGLGLVHNRNISLSEADMKKNDANKPITIFYGSGTKAHKDDFHNIVEPVFCRLHEKYGENVRFLIMGHISMTDMLKSLGSSLTLMEPVTDIETYWEILRSEADINLAVLSSTEVTDTKSEIKWLEAGMFGIPSVVSATATYDEVVDHGVTGFVCGNSDDFYDDIVTLIENEEAREIVGANAKAEILSSYSIENQSVKLIQAVENFKANSVQGKIRIALVNVFYPPEAIGGATRVVYDNVLELKQQFGDNLEIQVFCTTSGTTPYEMRQYEIDGVKVTAVACPQMANIDHNVSDQHMGFAFNRFLKTFNPDLVHFHCIQRLTESIVTEARRLDIPYLITAHDGWWVSDKQFLVDPEGNIDLYSHDIGLVDASPSKYPRARKLSRELHGAEKILAVSKPFENIYKSTGLNNVITIENGVSGLKSTDKTRSKSGKIRLAHIGGMERHKGLHILKNVLVSTPSIDNVELLVVDHSAPYGAIKKEHWGATEVTFVAKTLQSEVATLYSNIDVLVAPSVWPESFGLVTREALYCGCWVIASDRGCISGPVSDGENGFVISVDNLKELRDCLLEINQNTDRYLEPPTAKLELRSSREQAKDLYELYSSIVNNQAEPSQDSTTNTENSKAA